MAGEEGWVEHRPPSLSRLISMVMSGCIFTGDLAVQRSELMHPRHQKRATRAESGPVLAATSTKAEAAGDQDRRAPSVSPEEIRLCAYRKWENAGKPTGDAIRFWLEAEQELVRGK
jgi:hypothetical protein